MSRRTFKIRTTEGKVREILVPEKPRRALGAKTAKPRAQKTASVSKEPEKGAEDGKRQR